MAKVKVSVKLPDLDRMRKNLFQSANAGNQVVTAMKQSIGVGLSPVEGVGRFEAYASQRIPDKRKRYPKNPKTQREFPSKKVRPVNLTLSGQFLATLKARVIGNRKIEVGHLDIDARTKELFETHNEGKEQLFIPQRKYLPNKPGENFIQSIQQLLKKLVSDEIKAILK